ncbi:MAG: pyridoxal-phosphate dependent enzyme [Rhodospirillaceae bacterium]|nr:pyridoxal-phosphate dependent enzyme [Rhodospirillaceae bacterium]MDE0619243.1 pyridoxal-phosphate dependent enzyme [Rhodospirillaceae bacterium]
MNDAPNDASSGRALTLDRIEATRAAIAPWVVETPVLEWSGVAKDALLGAGTRAILKLELLQRTGSFKPRGALANILALDAARRAAGVTAVSAGNHAIAVAYAGRSLGVDAKVVMHRAANPFRIAQCRELGAGVVLADDIRAAFAEMARIRDEEGRAVIHPFEGPDTISGTATLGLEFARQAPDLDAVIVPVGGGGLIAGVATGFRLAGSTAAIYGVEPDGACGMRDSLARGAPLDSVAVSTIADSLGAPLHLPYSFGIVRQLVEEIVTVSDDVLQDAMLTTFSRLKLAVEPAGAAALAALAGPLHERLRGKAVGLIVCGANIDPAGFAGHLAAAQTRLDAAA